MSRIEHAKRKPESPEAGRKVPATGRVRASWRFVRDSAQNHPRWTVLFVTLLLVGVSWGGYRVIREYSARDHLRLARAAMNDGNYPAALADLDECLRVWPNDSETHLLLARTHWLDGNRADATRHLALYKEVGGDEQRIALELQLIAAGSGNLEKVETALQKHVEAGHPDRRYILEALIRGYIARHRAEDAERFATVWIEAAPENWQPWLYRGIARTLLSKDLLSTAHDNAKRDFHRVVELKPDHDMARLLLGNAYVMNGQFREALPHLEHYCRLKPEDAQGLSALAGCHRALGQIEDARRVIDDWLNSNTGTAEVFLIRGEIALDLAKPEEALDFFRRASTRSFLGEDRLSDRRGTPRWVGPRRRANTRRSGAARNKLKERLKELEQAAAKDPRQCRGPS